MRLIVSYTVVKRVCPVLCFKPFKIPFSVSCGLYRDNDRNKKTDLSCCKIQPGEIPRFCCPLQTAPVRTEGLFLRPHGCNIAYGKDPPSKAVAEVWPSFFENFSAAEFSPHLRRASCTFVRQIGICPTKVLALRGRAFSRVERLFNRYYGYQPKTDRHDRKEASNTEL